MEASRFDIDIRSSDCTIDEIIISSYYADGGHDNENTKTFCSSTCNSIFGYWTTSANSRSEETLRVLLRKTKFSGRSNIDTDIADYDDHYLESLFAGRTKSGIIYLGPDEMASKYKIRVNLKIGTKNTRIGVPRELEAWMKTTLYRDNTTLRWILFEDRVAPRHHRQLPDGVDQCVCMLQPARTTVDGVLLHGFLQDRHESRTATCFRVACTTD